MSPYNLIVLLLPGAALLWTVKLVYGRAGAPHDDVLRHVLWISGWLLIWLGLLGAIVSPFGAANLFLVPAVVLIGAMAVARYRDSERQALVWMFALAAEKGIPLSSASRAFADGRVDEMGLRTARLAEFLDAGVPLHDALRRARQALPLEAMLALRMVGKTSDMAAALRHTGQRDQQLETTLRSLCERIFYLMILVVVALSIITFLMIWIVPVFQELFADFEVGLPRITQGVIAVSQFYVSYWVLASPIHLLGLLLLVGGGMYYAGWLPRDLPVVDWFSRRFDAALVMRWLALTIRRHGNLVETIGALAQQYPVAGIRNRLARALRMIEQGADWCDSLQHVGLIGHADAAVLKAAQRVGNLPWALDEMADSTLRRLTYRLRAALNVLFPVALLLLGTCLGVVVIGLFVPLVELILGLV